MKAQLRFTQMALLSFSRNQHDTPSMTAEIELDRFYSRCSRRSPDNCTIKCADTPLRFGFLLPCSTRLSPLPTKSTSQRMATVFQIFHPRKSPRLTSPSTRYSGRISTRNYGDRLMNLLATVRVG